MSKSTKQIKAGAIISYVALLINILASLIYLPWMVSMIGKSNYALYTLASSFISLFMLDFGLSAAVSRFVAKYNAEGKQDKINEVVSTIVRLYIYIDIGIFIVLFVLFFFVSNIYKGLTDDEIVIFRQLYIIVALNSLVSFPFLPLSGILNAYELFVHQKGAELFQKLFSIILIVIVLLNGGDVRALVIANVISVILTIVIKLWMVKKHTKVTVKMGWFNEDSLKEVAKFSIWVTVMSLAQRCIFNIAPSVLGIVSNSTEIALFAPANALEGYFYSVSAAVNGLFLATISRFVAQNDDNRINTLMIRVGRYQFLLLGLVFIGFICVGHDFMINWMGADFVKAWPSAIILFVPDILIFSQQIANTTVIAKNRVKQQAIGYIIMALSCLIASFILSRAFGVIGACIAIAFGYSVLFVYMNILYYKHLNIDVFRFYRECYLKLLLPMIFVALIGYYICSRVIPYTNWVGVGIKGCTVLFIYTVVMSFFLTGDEKNMIKRVLKIK